MVSMTSELTSFVDICPDWALVDDPEALRQEEDSPLGTVGYDADEAQRQAVSPRFEAISGFAIQTGMITRSDLQPAPLKPSWILKGTPAARSLPLGQATDGNFSFGLWDCTAGQFLFKYRCDELVHILEGEATVRGPGLELHLRPGVVAFFPKGATLHWTVHRYIKKLAIFRSIEQSLLSRIAGKLKRVWQSLAPANGRKQSETPARTHLPKSHLSQQALMPQE